MSFTKTMEDAVKKLFDFIKKLSEKEIDTDNTLIQSQNVEGKGTGVFSNTKTVEIEMPVSFAGRCLKVSDAVSVVRKVCGNEFPKNFLIHPEDIYKGTPETSEGSVIKVKTREGDSEKEEKSINLNLREDGLKLQIGHVDSNGHSDDSNLEMPLNVNQMKMAVDPTFNNVSFIEERFKEYKNKTGVEQEIDDKILVENSPKSKLRLLEKKIEEKIASVVLHDPDYNSISLHSMGLYDYREPENERYTGHSFLTLDLHYLLLKEIKKAQDEFDKLKAEFPDLKNETMVIDFGNIIKMAKTTSLVFQTLVSKITNEKKPENNSGDLTSHMKVEINTVSFEDNIPENRVKIVFDSEELKNYEDPRKKNKETFGFFLSPSKSVEAKEQSVSFKKTKRADFEANEIAVKKENSKIQRTMK